ncbi:MAG TPA: matrixin family metalloprotease [Pyrinomonadaceae bacterium]|nr:matrixin family metalloprotease [Pyrinomonadaceae bacterium]
MRRPRTALFLLATVILSAVSVRPYTLQLTDASNSAQVRWPTNTITITLSTSLTTPQSNIKAGSDVLGAARRALRRWEEVANIRFKVASSDVQSVSAPGTRGDGLSLITVAHTAENQATFSGAASEMSGRTRIFSTVSGQINEADVVLNPGQSFSSDGTTGTYDLEATFMHEVGHLLGLEHSAVLGATMQPRQGRNGIYNLTRRAPRVLSEDDRAGARAIYGARLGAGVRGAIAGTISFSSGAPVFGANVWVEEAGTARVIASNVTLANGSYHIEGLQPGSYRVFAQPLGGAVFASEIASQRGAYAGLAIGQRLPFRTEELGAVNVTAGNTAALNAQLSGVPSLLNPSFIGTGGQLSTVAVPVIPSGTYKIFVAGEGISSAQLAKSGITSSSAFITIDPASIADADFGNGLKVVSFDLTVSADAPAGDYSLRLQSLTGEIAYLVGGLTVEAPEASAEVGFESLIGPIDSADTSADEYQAGG